jgi:2,3,4,5-tetrahydropyridine-2-carboxylate N-succinyltransferase
VRVAEKRDGEWVVNEDAKQAILDYFRERVMAPLELGPFEYHDKIPLKHGYEDSACGSFPRRRPGTVRSSRGTSCSCRRT